MPMDQEWSHLYFFILTGCNRLRGEGEEWGVDDILGVVEKRVRG